MKKLLLVLFSCLQVFLGASDAWLRDVNSIPDDQLYAAVEARDVPAMEDAVARGADVNERFLGGCTALHMAALNDDLKMFCALLRLGADAYKKNLNGETAFEVAKSDPIRSIIARASSELQLRASSELQFVCWQGEYKSYGY